MLLTLQKNIKFFALSSLTLMLLLALASFAFAILGQKRQKDKNFTAFGSTSASQLLLFAVARAHIVRNYDRCI